MEREMQAPVAEASEKTLRELLPKGWQKALMSQCSVSRAVVSDTVNGITRYRRFSDTVYEAATQLALDHQKKEQEKFASAQKRISKAALIAASIVKPA